MTFEMIMKEIIGGLTGDGKADIVYLKKQMNKYKDHELNSEILRACGRLIYKIIPEEQKENFSQAVSGDMLGTETILEEVQFCMYKGDLEKAGDLMTALVRKVEQINLFEDDTVSEYHTFSELFEEILYEHLYRPSKTLRDANIPFADIYMQYGSLLFEQKKYGEAREVLEKAVRWNPVNGNITFEYIETYKALGELEQFARLTRKAFQYAFHRKDIARCYRNMGYYFVEQELYSVAEGCYLLSLEFDSDPKFVQSELYYIQTKTGEKLKEPALEEIEKYAEQYEFPMGADDHVTGLAYVCGQRFIEEGDLKLARYFMQIVYELTQDSNIRDLLEMLTDDQHSPVS